MSSTQLGYDKRDVNSILLFARRLLGKSIHDLYPSAEYAKTKNKGGLGQRVEEVHFGFSNNSESDPDFKDAGVELKCTPLKLLKDGSMVSKERLVLNIINYLEEFDKTYDTSSFIRKNATLLLMFYLYLKDIDRFDLIFKIIRLWSIPEEDVKIFMDDWAVIHAKIANGQAHLLSESDTLYLAACVKGEKGGANKRKQRGSSILADQRAYSIKSSYVNQIIVDSISNPEMVSGIKLSARKLKMLAAKKAEIGRVVREVSEYKQGETFEQLVERKFDFYIGKSISEIEHLLGTSISNSPKAISYSVCRAILGVKEKKVAEFEKAGLILKTIRLEHNGTLKESMSFQNVRYCDIVNEESWQDSDWYNTIGRHRFFFVVFRKVKDGNSKDATLERAFFWGMPSTDVANASRVWQDTKDKVIAGDYSNFMTVKDGNPVSHIRPKGKKATDLMETPQGGFAKKMCYWLNRAYILDIVKNHLKYADSTKAKGKR